MHLQKERTIKLGQELISGPEITYANMDLVKVIRELIDPLQKDHKADCLRNIFLMGKYNFYLIHLNNIYIAQVIYNLTNQAEIVN